MPVEIEELVIRVVVTPSGTGASRGGSGDEPGARREEMVAEVVEQVLAILRQKEER